MTVRVLVLTAILWGLSQASADLRVAVVDRDGNPVADVVVMLEGPSLPETPEPGGQNIMDQVNIAFEPHVLVVQQGAEVEFPNSDSVAHHVYSFSKPNNFVLPLYRGEKHEPIRFEHPGVVVLGCNIHDGMVGYIVVTESAHFGKTNADGELLFAIEADTKAQVRIWSPRFRDKADTLIREIDLTTTESLTFELQKKLRPEHRSEPWQDY